jgi:hypothetical protein
LSDAITTRVDRFDTMTAVSLIFAITDGSIFYEMKSYALLVTVLDMLK